MPPEGDRTEKIEEDSRSNPRPIELIDSHAAIDPRSRTAALPCNISVVAASSLPLPSRQRLKCCDHPLNPPPIADSHSVRTNAWKRTSGSLLNRFCQYRKHLVEGKSVV